MEDIFKEQSTKALLEKGLKEIGSKWGLYCRYNQEVTKELVHAKYIVDLRGIEWSIYDPGKRWGFYVKNWLGLSRNADQILLVSNSFFPEFNQQRVFKKGKLLKIRPKNDASIRRALKEKLLEVANDGTFFVGYDWQGRHSSSREYRVTSLIEAMRAEIIVRELEKNGIENMIEPYPGKPETRGVNLVVHGIPSLSSNRTYTVALFHIAAYKDKISEAIPISYDLKEMHASKIEPCQKPLWYIVKDSRGKLPVSIIDEDDQREGDDLYFDYHAIVAFKLAQKYLEKGGFKVLSPFVYSSDLGRDSLHNFTNLKRVRKEKRVDGKIHRVPLTTLDQEGSLWSLKGYNNYPYLKGKNLI